MRFEAGEGLEERGAVALDLARAEAGDAVQIRFARGALGRELGQRAVVADDIGRKLGIHGELEPQLLQCGEERLIGRRDEAQALGLALVLGALLALGREAHEEALRAAKEWPCLVGEDERAVALLVTRHVAGGGELTEESAPGRSFRVLADAEDAELVVAVANDALLRLAVQHVDEIADAVALAGAIDGRERLLRKHGAVNGRRWIEAVVA